MIPFSGLYIDHYQLTMAEAFLLKGKQDNRAVYDYFFRRLPFDGGFAIFAGLHDLIGALEEFRFSDKDLNYLKGKGFHTNFLSYLRNFRFSGNIYACREGEVVFPQCPIVEVEANIIEGQMIETLLLNLLNFETLVATKAARLRLAAGNRELMEFGLRRAQGLGGFHASRAAFIGGFNSTSNEAAGSQYGIPVSGTISHSYIESYDSELEAFLDYYEVHPDSTVFLIDTYDTLASGLPNAIKAAKIMEEKGHRLKAVRLDSGDLAYLSKKCRKKLDQSGLDYVKIVVSNQLDEYIIKSLLDQNAPIDLFGVGTKLVTGNPDAALDGVYKLVFSDGKPRIKLSENKNKVTLPWKKQVFRFSDSSGMFIGADAITIFDEDDPDKMYHPLYPEKSFALRDLLNEPLLSKIVENGIPVSALPSPGASAEFCRTRMSKLPEEYKRFDYPHRYKVGISNRLANERDKLIRDLRKTYESANNY